MRGAGRVPQSAAPAREHCPARGDWAPRAPSNLFGQRRSVARGRLSSARSPSGVSEPAAEAPRAQPSPAHAPRAAALATMPRRAAFLALALAACVLLQGPWRARARPALEPALRAHANASAAAPVAPLPAAAAPPPAHPAPLHTPSRLFEHFDLDKDGLLSEKEVAALLKLITRKKKEEDPAKAPDRPAGTHDISIDGETLSVGAGEFDLLFKQLSNLKQTKDPSKDPRMTLQEDIVFVKDLVIVFLAATMGGVIATNFRQPPLIGFLLGGMVVGPGGFGVVTELVEVETLASLGIAFLLFSLGIEFSITELQGVRRVVVVGGISSTVGVVLGTGFLSLILSLVKSIPEAVALGLAVSLSSTAVVLQCLPGTAHGAPAHSAHSESGSATEASEDKYAHESPNNSDPPALSNVSKVAPFSFDAPRSRKTMLGLLVFQDVMIGLILAMLPTLQGSLGQFVEELLSAMLRLGCFVMLSLILAEFILPSLSERLDAAKSQEVFTIGCVVFCLAMAYLSEEMGLAIELGAFTAGIMLSESRHKTRVEDCISSIRSIFSAVFFVSVGMMIHWRYFYQNFVKMAVLLVVVLAIKTLVMGLVICALGGLPLRTAMACGSAIAQAGEFTFVIASKGQALQLFSASEARMINGATALSMLATPYIIRYARKWTSRNGSSMQRGDLQGV